MKDQRGRKNHMWREIPKDKLEELYLKDKLSTLTIAKIFNTSDRTIANRLRLYNIQMRTFNEQVRLGIQQNIEKFRNASSGKKNPAYIHGKKVGQKANRRIYIEIAKQHNKWKCFFCPENKTKMDLIVHHIDGNNRNNDPKNLMILCQSCHARTHFKKGEFERVKNGFLKN